MPTFPIRLREGGQGFASSLGTLLFSCRFEWHLVPPMADPADTAAQQAAQQQLESKRIELAAQLTAHLDNGVLQKCRDVLIFRISEE